MWFYISTVFTLLGWHNVQLDRIAFFDIILFGMKLG